MLEQNVESIDVHSCTLGITSRKNPQTLYLSRFLSFSPIVLWIQVFGCAWFAFIKTTFEFWLITGSVKNYSDVFSAHEKSLGPWMLEYTTSFQPFRCVDLVSVHVRVLYRCVLCVFATFNLFVILERRNPKQKISNSAITFFLFILSLMENGKEEPEI